MDLTAHGIEAKVRTLADEVVARNGFDLVDVEYKRDVAGWTLTLFIDKQGGVNLDDCQRMSHVMSTVLDVEVPGLHHYNLQVSSPGLDRPLTKPADFRGAIGRQVRVATKEPLGNRRNFTGILRGVAEEEGDRMALHVLDETGAEHAIPVAAVKRANIVHEWPAAGPAGGDVARSRTGRKR